MNRLGTWFAIIPVWVWLLLAATQVMTLIAALSRLSVYEYLINHWKIARKTRCRRDFGLLHSIVVAGKSQIQRDIGAPREFIVASLRMLLKTTGLAGLALNVILVWINLGLSIVLLLTSGGSTGFDEQDPRGAPWTPPGEVIGGVWTILYTLMGVSLWAVNYTPAKLQPRLRMVVLALVVFCLVWPFYAFGTSSRWPGLLGNLGILTLSVLAFLSLLPHSRLAAALVAPVAIWISVATATIIDGAVRYGW